MLTAKKKSEIIAFLWLVLAGLLFLCLISYNPDDIAFQVSEPNQPVQNFVGMAGAYVSWALFLAIGQGSYFLVALFCFWALAQWSERQRQSLWLKILSGGLFFVSSCASLSLLAGELTSAQFQAGGLVGYFSASLLLQLFGQAAILVSGALFFLALLLATEFMIFPLVIAAVHTLQRWGRQGFFKAAAVKNKDAESGKARTLFSKPQKIKIKSAQAPDSASPFQKAKKILFSKEKEKKAEPKPDVFEKPIIRSSLAKSQSSAKESSTPKATKPVSVASGNYTLPSLDLLDDAQGSSGNSDAGRFIEEQSRILQDTLTDFGVDAKVVEVEQGPVITRFELQPASGVKLQKITSLQDNIALALQATSVRILAPIPGKARIGIEVPNPEKQIVNLKDILISSQWRGMSSKLAIALGKDAAGETVVADLDAMPHLLIAGSTGSGKTVCMNTILMSMIFRSTPEEVRFILIDPKMVELTGYNGIPHLLTPVITELDKVPSVLSWLVAEMQRRYRVLSKSGSRDVESYNEKISKITEPEDNGDGESAPERLPYIVVIIDELADLMMAKGKEVEIAITRLAQLARAVGIHMILATQRPSVDVITGVIKANFPARISFQVASKVDSRTVLDANGAECLLGRGDLLYMDPAKSHLMRGQGAWVTDQEIERTVSWIKDQQKPVYHDEILQAAPKQSGRTQDFRGDEYYEEACQIIVSSGQASVSMLQRRLGLGYTRAARLVDMMEEDGIVGPHRGSKPRNVLMTLEDLSTRLNKPEAAKAENSEG